MSSIKMGLFLAATLLISSGAWASAVTLENGNSTLSIDPASVAGDSSWVVDGKNLLAKQWFWYRVGGSGPEASIDAIGAPTSVTVSDGDGDNLNDRAVLKYAYTAGNFRITVDQMLTGGTAGSGVSDISVVIKITNLGNTKMDFHLFQLCDLDLDAAGDTVAISGGNTADQSGGMSLASESVVTTPSHHAVGLDGSLLTALNDASATTLDDSNGPVTGNAQWAFQWDFSINPGSTAIVSKDLTVVPEPATMVLLALGGLVTFRRRNRK